VPGRANRHSSAELVTGGGGGYASAEAANLVHVAVALGVTSDMLAYASTALKEYDKHVETYSRLQWFAKSGGVVTPDLYFEIVCNQSDDV